jgi:hypothetical protein
MKGSKKLFHLLAWGVVGSVTTAGPLEGNDEHTEGLGVDVFDLYLLFGKYNC